MSAVRDACAAANTEMPETVEHFFSFDPAEEHHYPLMVGVSSSLGTHGPRYERCRELSDAIESGAFNNVLLDAFGDHAEIRVTRKAIEIGFYDHD
jgi:hypothetical protein